MPLDAPDLLTERAHFSRAEARELGKSLRRVVARSELAERRPAERDVIAHLREQNHSQRFWRLVADRCPDYLEAEAELRRYWVILERNRVWRRLQDSR